MPVSFRRNGKHKTTIRLRRTFVFLGTPADIDIDHVDCDGLNNRRSNLRSATCSQDTRKRENQLKQHFGIQRRELEQARAQVASSHETSMGTEST